MNLEILISVSAIIVCIVLSLLIMEEVNKFKSQVSLPLSNKFSGLTDFLEMGLLNDSEEPQVQEKPVVLPKLQLIPTLGLNTASINSVSSQAGIHAKHRVTQLQEQTKAIDIDKLCATSLTGLPQKMTDEAKRILENHIATNTNVSLREINLGLKMLKIGYSYSDPNAQSNQVLKMQGLIDAFSDCIESLKDHDNSMMKAIVDFQKPVNGILEKCTKLLNDQPVATTSHTSLQFYNPIQYHFTIGNTKAYGIADNNELKITLKQSKLTQQELRIWKERFDTIKKCDPSRWSSILTGDLTQKYPINKPFLI